MWANSASKLTFFFFVMRRKILKYEKNEIAKTFSELKYMHGFFLEAWKADVPAYVLMRT
mgnify:CR=1 FL=1